MCLEPIKYSKEKIVGKCPDCKTSVVIENSKRVAAEGCWYSPCECKTCGYRPCDGSC